MTEPTPPPSEPVPSDDPQVEAAERAPEKPPAAPARRPAAQRPGGGSERRGFFTKLRAEWSLLVLAALLTGVVWYLARENVLGDYKIGPFDILTTQAEQDPEISVALKDAQVTILLHCSKQTMLELKERVEVNGGLEFEVGERPAGDERVIDTKHGDHFVYPFSDHYVRSAEMKLPQGRVVRRELQTIPVVEPKLPVEELEKGGLTVAILGISPAQLKQIVPKSMFEDNRIEIVPDPLTLDDLGIDATDFTFNEPIRSVPLSFEVWRKGRSETGRRERGQLLKKLEQGIRAQVRITRTAERALLHSYVIMVKPEVLQTYAIEPASQILDEGDRTGFSPLSKSFTGIIQGTSTDLAKLGDTSLEGEWHWGIVFDKETQLKIQNAMNTSDQDKFDVKGSLRLILTGKLRGLPLTFVPEEGQGENELEFTFKRLAD